MTTKDNLEIVLSEISKNKQVEEEVKKNFENNLWWPNTVKDKDMRLIIAGLSTRISYSMINTYKKVIKQLETMSFDEFSVFSEKKKTEILKPLGLIKTRLGYVESMSRFIKTTLDIDALSDDEFLEKVDKEVKNASYKVAQCCLLYRKLYPNNIMPVDSGMKDVMLPCLGYPKQKEGRGHELARKLLEQDVTKIDKPQFIRNNNLNISENEFNWWAHLSLIYYKRAFCNKKNPQMCIFNDIRGLKLNYTCGAKNSPKKG
jgi:endonuclease III